MYVQTKHYSSTSVKINLNTVCQPPTLPKVWWCQLVKKCITNIQSLYVNSFLLFFNEVLQFTSALFGAINILYAVVDEIWTNSLESNNCPAFEKSRWSGKPFKTTADGYKTLSPDYSGIATTCAPLCRQGFLRGRAIGAILPAVRCAWTFVFACLRAVVPEESQFYRWDLWSPVAPPPGLAGRQERKRCLLPCKTSRLG